MGKGFRVGAIALFASIFVAQAATTTDSAVVEPTISTFSDAPVPRWASVKFSKANGRQGPGTIYPVLWQYRQAGLPVEIIEETEGWRRIRDHDGDVVWLHDRLIDDERSVLVRADNDATALRRRPDADARVAAMVKADVVMSLERCEAGWCRVSHDDARGWMRAGDLWGIYPEEAL